MLKSESVIAAGLMGLSAYFMWHARVLPIGWIKGEGPGGGAFPFWISLVMFAMASVILLRSLRVPAADRPFFDPDTRGPVASVAIALTAAIALMPILGAYVALTAFLVWYLRFFGRHGWGLTLAIALGANLVMFFFFEVALRILMPKGITEPLFIPLYQIFF